MKFYSTYIFDLDGTITDTTSVWHGIFRDGLLRFDVQPPINRVLAKHTHDFAEMLKLGLPKQYLSAFIDFAHKQALERLPEASLHKGAYKTIEALRENGKHIAIFSTMDRPIFEPAMRHRSLDTLIDVSIAGTDVPHRKPHPAGILKALADLGIPEEEYEHAVYIGDKGTDIQAAYNAGVDSILFYPPAHQEIYDFEELKKYKPKYIITDWKELLP